MDVIHITINRSILDELINQNCIQDYTDDGYVLKEEAGWIPAGDVLEYLVNSEVLYEEKEGG
tara:strand:+ start:1206 stop:1391 length:186 start_codon:yes stop_codon:yes gene_type:complete